MTKQPITGAKFIGYDLRNKNTKEGQHGITVGYGIGETVKKYAADNNLDPSLQTTIQATNDAGYRRVLDTSDAHDFVAAMDKYEFNTAVFASLDNYSAGEYEADLAYMRDVQKCDRASLIVHSQGGYGLSNQIVKNPALADQLDGVVWVASGPGNLAAAPIIAKAGFANWFIVSEDDTHVAGDLCAWSTNMHNAILKVGGKSYLTILTKENNFSNPHTILGLVLTYWGTDGAKAISSLKINGTVPKMNAYEFLLSNGKGLPAVAPDGVFKPIAKAYQSTTDTKPVTDTATTTGGATIEPSQPLFIETIYMTAKELTIYRANAAPEVKAAPKGETIVGCNFRFDKTTGKLLSANPKFSDDTSAYVTNLAK